MMADMATFKRWIDGTGLHTRLVVDATLEELWVSPSAEEEPIALVRRRNDECAEVVHERRLDERELHDVWAAPWDGTTPTAVVNAAVGDMVLAFPLVGASTAPDGAGLELRLVAPVFHDELSRQAFLFTLSSVLNAAHLLTRMSERRADALADWRRFEGALNERNARQQELIEQITRPTVAVPTASPTPAPTNSATIWTPTHELARRSTAWVAPDPSSAVAGTLERRVPVEVLEWRGEWCHVRCSNDWSAWVDRRALKSR